MSHKSIFQIVQYNNQAAEQAAEHANRIIKKKS
jgi:hypothetical protein